MATQQTTLSLLYPAYARYIEHLAPRCRLTAHTHYGPPTTEAGFAEAHHALQRLMQEGPYADLADVTDAAYGAVCWVAAKSVDFIDDHAESNVLVPDDLTDTEAVRIITKGVWPHVIATELVAPH